MPAIGDGASCHIKTCTQPATATCDRCGQPCCPAHLRHVTVERRVERTLNSSPLGQLARLPTRTESYTLCLRCSGKPVPSRGLGATP
jgi:hypothetical protein